MSKVQHSEVRHARWKEKLLIGILVLMILCGGCFYLLLPPKYNWTAYDDFGEVESKEPYGAYFLNQYLRQEWNEDVCQMSVYDEDGIAELLSERPYNIVLLNKSNIANADMAQILIENLKNGGNNIVYALCQESNSYGHFPVGGFIEHYDDLTEQDREVKWINVYQSDTGELEKDYSRAMEMPEVMINLKMHVKGEYAVSKYAIKGFPFIQKKASSSKTDIKSLLFTGQGVPVAIRARMDNGNMTFLASQAFLSNYMLSNENRRRCLDHLLGNTFDRNMPVMLIVPNGSGERVTTSSDEENNGMFKVLLQHEETRLAYYLLLLAMLLTLLFNIRRRRAVRKEKTDYTNSSITYVQHLSSLYTKDTDYRQLLQIELRSLLRELRDEYRFDSTTIDYQRPSQYARLIAVKNGGDAGRIRRELLSVEAMADGASPVHQEQYVDALRILDRKRPNRQKY